MVLVRSTTEVLDKQSFLPTQSSPSRATEYVARPSKCGLEEGASVDWLCVCEAALI